MKLNPDKSKVMMSGRKEGSIEWMGDYVSEFKYSEFVM